MRLLVEICSFLLLLLGSTTLDVRSVGNMKSLHSLKSKLSQSLGVERKVLDNFSDSVAASSENVGSVDESAGRVLLSFGDFVVRLVLLEESDDLSGAFL